MRIGDIVTVADIYEVTSADDGDAATRLADAVRAVAVEHRPDRGGKTCRSEGWAWPCRTARVLAEALGVEVGEGS